jgi:hypothetical protein
MHTKFWLANLKGKDHSVDLGVDGKINISVELRETGREGVDWIHLAQDRDQWWANVKMVMYILVP